MWKWNVIVTVNEHHFREACRLLKSLGHVAKTDYFNVVTLQVDDIGQFLIQLHRLQQDDPHVDQYVNRVLPVNSSFTFQDQEEFEEKAKAVVEPWVEQLTGSRFHVRMHRRGFKGRILSQQEEQFLDHFLKTRLAERGATAKIEFENPDFIIAIETIGHEAGISLWPRESLRRYPMVKLD